MKHGIKKVKFHSGQDANEALVRKLAIGFINHGKLETTINRVKVIKSVVDRLTYKAINARQSDRNVILSELGNVRAYNRLVNVIAPEFKGQASGFVRFIRLGKRQGDAASVARLEWIKEITPDETATLAATGNKAATKLSKEEKKLAKDNAKSAKTKNLKAANVKVNTKQPTARKSTTTNRTTSK